MRLNHVDTFLTGNVHIPANGQVLTDTQRVRCGVVVRLRQKVLLHVARRGHQRVTIGIGGV